MAAKVKVIEVQLRDVELANCTSTDPELFFPDMEEKRIVRKVAQICAMCPIVEGCLNYAIKNEDFGIWGGAGTLERKRMKRDDNLRVLHLNDMRIIREREIAREEKRNG